MPHPKSKCSWLALLFKLILLKFNPIRKETLKNLRFALRRNQAKVSSSTVYKAKKNFQPKKELFKKIGECRIEQKKKKKKKKKNSL